MFPKGSKEFEGRLLGVEEAAAYLGVNVRSIYRLVERGIVRPVQIPGIRRILFDREDMDALVEEAKAPMGGSQQ